VDEGNKHYTIYSAPEMHVVPHIVGALFGHIHRIGQVKDSENKSRNWYWNEHDENTAFRMNNDAGKQNGRNRPACPNRIVVIVFAVFEIGGENTYQKRGNIKHQVKKPAFDPKLQNKDVFDQRPE